jgi:branched-chain amino acid transport system substrate-binding protein
MRFHTLIGAVGLLTVACIANSCSKNSIPPSNAVVKIGAIYPLTGPASSLGTEFKRGAEIAQAAAAKKGVNIEVLFEDTKTDPKAAISAYQKLKGDGVRLFLTTVSSTALALIPIAEQDKTLLFADVAQPGITGKNKLLFRHSSTADQEAKIVFDHLTTEKRSAVGMMWMNDDYGAAFKQEMERLIASGQDKSPLKIKSESFNKTDTDLRPVALQALSEKPDTVIVAGFGTPMGLAIRRLRESGYNGSIVATMGFTVTPDAVTAAGDAADGVMHTYMRFDENDTDYQTFAGAYKERYGSLPPTFAALAHNSVLLLADAIKSGSSDPETIATAILSHTSFRAAGEELTVAPNGDILPNVSLKAYNRDKQ